MIVDVHAHALHPDFLDRLVANPGLGPAFSGDRENGFRSASYGLIDRMIYDLPPRLESLRRRAVGLQLVSPPPPIMSTMERAASLELATAANRSTARLVDEAGGLLRGLAILPLGDPGEIERHLLERLETGRFAGIALPTTIAGRPWDEPELAFVWALIERLGLFIFMHSTSAVARPTLGRYTLNTLVQYPTETAIAAARLVFSGLFERHPGIKLVLSHGGGTLPFLAGRIDLGYLADGYEHNPDCRAAIRRRPSSYFKQLYFDTLVSSADSLRMLIAWAGPSQLLFGSDFPYEIGDPEGANALPVIEALDPASRAAILSGNALRLLEGRLASAA
jgi:aminocarboxymuconate-semialdehyde decarboxylase